MKPVLVYTLAASALAQDVTVPIEADFRPVVGGDWSPTTDPLRHQQWGLEAIGHPPPLEPWQRVPRLAVCDSGVGDWHEDITTDLELSSVVGPDPHDDMGHGTHVLGIAAACTGNGLGVAGALAENNAPSTSVKVLLNGVGDVPGVASGIVAAATAGAAVINCSLQGPGGPEMREAAEICEAEGAIVVFAAGNDRGGPVSGLASDRYWIVVSSIDESLTISAFSSVGPRVDFCAPGSAVLSCFPFDGKFSFGRSSEYVKLSGTSMAAPHVSGTIVRMRAERALTRAQAYTALRYTAVDLGEPGRDPLYGWGLVQAAAAVDLVRWNRADFDRDGKYTSLDFLAFQTAFGEGRFTADFDLDGELTFLDLLMWMEEWRS